MMMVMCPITIWHLIDLASLNLLRNLSCVRRVVCLWYTKYPVVLYCLSLCRVLFVLLYQMIHSTIPYIESHKSCTLVRYLERDNYTTLFVGFEIIIVICQCLQSVYSHHPYATGLFLFLFPFLPLTRTH